ncbi:MAG: GatB/YqeY domain-containing protein [Planctomycetota bacterium]
MGGFLSRISADMKAAMKAGDKARLSVLRMLISELKTKALDAAVDELDDEAELAVLRRAVKTRQDAVAQAEAAGRRDVVERESAEIAVIRGYLPAQMTPEEIAAKVAELAAEIGFSGPGDRGRFMKEWMARYKGKADGRFVQKALGDLGT